MSSRIRSLQASLVSVLPILLVIVFNGRRWF
jgi:hypothetical protein